MLSEIKLQTECFIWAWNNLPQTRLCIFHVPNGGLRSKVEAAQLKASGVIAGIPDILFIWNGRIHAFEFKTKVGQLSPVQRAVHAAWKGQRVDVHVVRSFDQFKELIISITN